MYLSVFPMWSAASVQVHRAATSAQRTPAGVRGGGGGAHQSAQPRNAPGGQAALWRCHPEAHAERLQQRWRWRLHRRAGRPPSPPRGGHQGEGGAGRQWGWSAEQRALGGRAERLSAPAQGETGDKGHDLRTSHPPGSTPQEVHILQHSQINM